MSHRNSTNAEKAKKLEVEEKPMNILHHYKDDILNNKVINSRGEENSHYGYTTIRYLCS